MEKELLTPVVFWSIVLMIIFIMTCYLYVPYYFWKARYMMYSKFHSIQRQKIKNECAKEVICIHGTQLFYLKNIYDEKHYFNCWWKWWVQISGVEELWLSHGPKADVTDALIKCLPNGTIIYIGRLVHYTWQDRQGLKTLLRKGYKLKVWEDESDKVDPKYKSHLFDYIEQLIAEQIYLQDVVKIACAELHVTHLLTNNPLTNKRELYRSDKNDHAEAKFCKDISVPVRAESIDKIWIKNSPCANCSQKLLNCFKGIRKKPEILIGRIYRLDDKDDFKEMKNLYANGFEVRTWNEFLMHSDSDKQPEQTQTARYIRDMKQKTVSYH